MVTIKTVFRPVHSITWDSLRPFVMAFQSTRIVAIGEDIDSGNNAWFRDGAKEADQHGYYIWDYNSLVTGTPNTWISWLTMHFFEDRAEYIQLEREDADLFLIPNYRQNPNALSELYVWDSTEVLVVSALEIQDDFRWRRVSVTRMLIE